MSKLEKLVSRLQIFYTDINFSEVWVSQILDLGKQFTLMIRLENNFARRLKYVLKTSSKRLEDVLKTFYKTSWRHFQDEDVIARRVKYVLKTSWRCLQNVLKKDVLKTFLQNVLKTLEDVWPRRIYWSWSRRLEEFLETLL